MSNITGRNLAATDSLQLWREDLLGLILRAAAVLGLITVIVNLLAGEIGIFLLIYIGLYAGVLLLVFFRLPYSYRAGLLLLVTYGFGLRGLLTTGIWGDSRVFFIAFIVLASFLFSTRVAIAASSLVIATTAIVGGLVLTGQWTIPDPSNLSTWLVGTSTVIVIAAVILLSVKLLLDRYKHAESTRDNSLNTVQTLQQEKNNLEQTNVAHSLELWRKTNQLRAASEVARQVTEIRDLDLLLRNTVTLAAQQFEFYHVGLFLIDDNGRYAVLHAASSEGGRTMLENGHRLEVGAQGIVGYVAEQGRPRVALDVGEDAVFFNNPHLPMTSSEMALPLIVHEKVIGVLDIQSEKARAFQQEDVDLMQTLADQLAVAIENARLFSSTQQVIRQLEAVTFSQTRDAWQNYLKRRWTAYQYTPLGIKSITGSAQNPNGRQSEFPLVLHGQQIGSIRMQREGDAAGWSRREEELIRDVARQVALALDNSRLLEETNRRIAEEHTLGEITTRLGRTLDFDTLLQTAARELGQLPDVAEVSVFVGNASEDKRDTPRTGRLRG